MKKTVFSSADILLPDYAVNDERWSAYSVIACDQFTSEPEYWDRVEKLAGEKLSCYGLVLPEAYLETEREECHRVMVAENMKSIGEKLKLHKNCLIYVERTLPDGRIRRGIVGKVDLEAYDFSPDSSSAIRATEETVVSRIPPRVAIRKEAAVELPHVMIFAADEKKAVFEPLSKRTDEMTPLYSFELMLSGGSIKGYKIENQLLSEALEVVLAYEESVEGGLVYAMGDGNHSLASAKAHFDDIKAAMGDAAMEHPARYALCEIVDLYDDSIEFEPIYRLLINCDKDDVLSYIEKRAGGEKCVQTSTVIWKNGETKVDLPPLHALSVGSLQMIIDDYLSENPGVACDYIHGEESLRALAAKNCCVGFLCDGVEKESLFAYVAENGALPRKTFSMGEAAGKRYYNEARIIVK